MTYKGPARASHNSLRNFTKQLLAVKMDKRFTDSAKKTPIFHHRMPDGKLVFCGWRWT